MERKVKRATHDEFANWTPEQRQAYWDALAEEDRLWHENYQKHEQEAEHWRDDL